MPERYNTEFLKINNNNDVRNEVIFETIECPKCHFKIPVEEQFMDYKILYERVQNEIIDIRKKYTKILLGKSEGE